MTKKFWCHYVGSDGNTPKRRNIELKNLAELIPAISDNKNCATPLWYNEYDEKHIEMFAQLSDTVAVSTLIMGIVRMDAVDLMRMTDDDIKAEGQQRLARHLECHKDYSPADIERETKWFTNDFVDGSKQNRDRELAKVMQYKDYTSMLLNGAWIANATLRGYEEAQSPYIPVLQELRRQAMEKRKRDEEERKEERRKAAEEEARKKAEAEQKEQERLTGEAEKFKQGESISGSDVVDLCRRYNIAIHLRTVHNLQQVIFNINGKTGSCQYYRTRGKRRPQLDGCYKTAGELYKYLQTH